MGTRREACPQEPGLGAGRPGAPGGGGTRLTRPGRAQLHHLDDLLVAMEVQCARPFRGLHADLPAHPTPPPQLLLPPFSPASTNPRPPLSASSQSEPASSPSPPPLPPARQEVSGPARRTLGNAVFYSSPAAPSAGRSSTADRISRHAAGPRESGTVQHGGGPRRTAR